MAKLSSPLTILAVIGLLILSGFTLWPRERAVSQQQQSNSAKATPSRPGEQQAASQDSSPPAQDQSHRTSSQQAEEAPPKSKAGESVVQDEGDLRKLTIKQLIDLSTRIVLAKCRAVSVRESAGGNIFTFSEFEAERMLKGSLPPKGFTLRLLGGRVGDVEISSELMPKFTPGAEVVLFLGRDNEAGYPTVFPQGVFRVRNDSTDKRKHVTPKPEGLPLFRAQDQQPYSNPPESLPLEDFLFSLQKLIRGS